MLKQPDNTLNKHVKPASWFLVVDDEPQICNLMKEILSANPDWKTTTCSSVQQALDEIKANPGQYDVIFTDLIMPDQNGFEFLDKLDRLDPSIICIVVTGHASTHNVIKSVRKRAFDIIEKPFDAASLHAIAMHALAERYTRQGEIKMRAALELTCSQQTIALQKTVQDLWKTQNLLVEKIAAMVDMREHNTGTHSKRVADMLEVIAQYMELPAQDIEQLRYGALLHDLGKIAVPDAILLKTEQLTPDERVIINRHVEYATDILKDIPFLGKALDLILHHHERYDGTGYPKGVRGKTIPLGARIFSVVDAYEAMRSNRCYSKALSPEAARAELENNAGTQFDPEIVTVFIECLPKIEAIIQKNK